MQLISLELNGTFKGLKNQKFDFIDAKGKIIALIGLNGSGKSQILELISEIFAYIERQQRKDFLINSSLGYGFQIVYTVKGGIEDVCIVRQFAHANTIEVQGGKTTLAVITKKGNLDLYQDERAFDKWSFGLPWPDCDLENLPIPQIVGYSSGLNSNLQRSFMKNANCYYEAQRIKEKRRKQLKQSQESDFSDINNIFVHKYPHIFQYDYPSEYEKRLVEADTSVSKLSYIDYDSSQLYIASLMLLKSEARKEFFEDLPFKDLKGFVIEYDLRSHIFDVDIVKDIQLMIRLAGDENFKPISQQSSDEDYDAFELDYFAGRILIDLEDVQQLERFQNYFYDFAFNFFSKLYKIQQLGVKKWSASDRKALKIDNYFGVVKKPLKAKLPLSITDIKFCNEADQCINFDDISDGEAQLLYVLSSIAIYKDDNVLYLFDEPETHLNPAWRTYFHKRIERVIQLSTKREGRKNVFMTTHSPFMISSLKKENVLRCFRDESQAIFVEKISDQTYGASFDYLIKEYFDLKSLISQSVIDELREKLKEDDTVALQWIEDNLGYSPEKLYLTRKLKG